MAYFKGDRIFTHYDFEFGTIVRESGEDNSGAMWYDVEYDSGRRALLDASRMMSEANGKRYLARANRGW